MKKKLKIKVESKKMKSLKNVLSLYPKVRGIVSFFSFLDPLPNYGSELLYTGLFNGQV